MSVSATPAAAEAITTPAAPHPASGLRVAYIMSRFPKISETFILYEMLEQERNGVAIELYPLLREKQPVAHREAEDYLQRANFHPFFSLKVLQANLHFLLRRPRRFFGTFFFVLRETWGSLNFFVGALGIFPKAVRFAYEMQRKRVTHVHAHFCNHPAVAAFIVRRLTGIPYSFTAHGSDLHVERRMLAAKVKEAAFAVTVSAFNKQVMLESCGQLAETKIHVIHCGIDPEIFVPGQRQRNDGVLRLICVASFEEVKGHTYLIAAIEQLVARGMALQCDLIGDGPQRQRIAVQIEETDLQSRVLIHGPKPRHEVVRMLRTADIKVLPSVPTVSGKREGIPVVLMEAMAMALPVISSRLSGIPELVTDGETGILVAPRDVTALAGAIERLAHDPALRRRMGCAGREKVLREFNLKKNTARLRELILRHSTAANGER